jgi:hypothetical protein
MTGSYVAVLVVLAIMMSFAVSLLLYGGVRLVKAVQNAKPGDRARDER